MIGSLLFQARPLAPISFMVNARGLLVYNIREPDLVTWQPGGKKHRVGAFQVSMDKDFARGQRLGEKRVLLCSASCFGTVGDSIGTQSSEAEAGCRVFVICLASVLASLMCAGRWGTRCFSLLCLSFSFAKGSY